jgi:branched-chain amino acid transport system permease protein
VLRPLGVWRMVLMPLVLVLLMIFRPRGIMGLREMRWFIPRIDLDAVKNWRKQKEAAHGTPAD